MAEETELERLTRENDYLRVLAQKAGCPYNNTNENGSCKSGYPGCACLDDIMIALKRYEDEKQ